MIFFYNVSLCINSASHTHIHTHSFIYIYKMKKTVFIKMIYKDNSFPIVWFVLYKMYYILSFVHKGACISGNHSNFM